MAIEKQEVAAALRDASTQISALTDQNANLESEKVELLSKIASLELRAEDNNSDDLSKQASQSDGNQYLGFGMAEQIPGDIALSADEKMSAILSGEYLE